MFDRHTERKELSSMLGNEHPELVIVTGPRDTQCMHALYGEMYSVFAGTFGE